MERTGGEAAWIREGRRLRGDRERARGARPARGRDLRGERGRGRGGDELVAARREGRVRMRAARRREATALIPGSVVPRTCENRNGKRVA